MKLLKKPVFAVFLCLVIVIGSTLLSGGGKLQHRYNKVCDNLCDEIAEFADENHLPSLKVKAQTALLNGDYQQLISAYQTELDSLNKYEDADDVDDAIKDYTLFVRKLTSFPARSFAQLLNLSF